MESIIYLLLFTYPGAFVQLFRKKFLPQYAPRSEEDATLKACRYFVDSCSVLALTLPIYYLVCGQSATDLKTLIESLQTGWSAAIYAVIALPATGMYTVIRHYLVLCVNKKRMETSTNSAWGEMLEWYKNPKWSSLEYPVVALSRNGKLITAGIPRALSSDSFEPHDMMLEGCEQVMQILTNDSIINDYIEGSIASYVNIDEGYELTFYAAPKLHQLCFSEEPEE